jgi:hypothetical protein
MGKPTGSLFLVVLAGCSAVAGLDELGISGDDDTATGSDGDADGDADSDADGDADSDTDGDTDSDADGDTDSDADGDTDTGSTVCPEATHECVEGAVAGWGGPAALYLGDAEATPPACDGGYPEPGIDGFTDLSVGSATCACGCGEAEGTTCAGSGLLQFHGTTATCDTASPSWWSLSNSCTMLGGEIFGNRYWRFDSSGLTVSGGGCAISTVEALPEPEFLTRILACGGATDAGGCADGEQCLPDPPPSFEGRPCIWKAGDVLCPSGSAYDQRSLFHTGYTDSRDCSPCGCSAPAGSCAGSFASLVDLANCGMGSVNLGDLPGSGECVLSAATPMTRGAVLNRVVVAACTSSGGVLSGTVTPGNPYTVCCLAP